MIELLSAILRMTDRATKQAFDEQVVVTDGPDRNFHARRDLAWLTDDDLSRVKDHLDAITQILAQSRRERCGKLYALTTYFMPVVMSADPQGRRLPPGK